MEILYLLIPVSVALVFAIAVAFWWSVRSGQFDDLEGPAFRILMDEDHPAAPPATPENKSEKV
jgi:cbb3-type cytochrome oxidase maturation protein